MLKPSVLWISLLLALITSTTLASEPQVVATIKPIHALVSGVMEGVGTPYLLLSGGESPHAYSLQPSQVRRLHAANLVVWVGPTVEAFLEKTLTSLSDKTQIIRLIEVPELTLLKVREGDAWKTHPHKPDHDDSHPTQFDIDPHIWLDPNNAIILVQAIAQTLMKMDTNNAARYQANATRLVEQLVQLNQSLKQQLAPFKELSYLVFHDAYQYFEHRYQLAAMGAITLSPENRPSVKQMYQLRRTLKSQQIRCVFSEPQFESALVATVIEGTPAQRGVLDPLGAELAAGTDSYFLLLRNMAHSLKQCLSGQ